MDALLQDRHVSEGRWKHLVPARVHWHKDRCTRIWILLFVWRNASRMLLLDDCSNIACYDPCLWMLLLHVLWLHILDDCSSIACYNPCREVLLWHVLYLHILDRRSKLACYDSCQQMLRENVFLLLVLDNHPSLACNYACRRLLL